MPGGSPSRAVCRTCRSIDPVEGCDDLEARRRLFETIAHVDRELLPMLRSLIEELPTSVELVRVTDVPDLALFHVWDRSTSTSHPGAFGSKPCSISQRIASRLRTDHHPRMASRSTAVP